MVGARRGLTFLWQATATLRPSSRSTTCQTWSGPARTSRTSPASSITRPSCRDGAPRDGAGDLDSIGPARSRHGGPMSTKPSDRPRPPSVDAVVNAARAVVDDERARLGAGEAARSTEALGMEVAARIEAFADAGPLPVINATGVIVHTNLGRAPWADGGGRVHRRAGRALPPPRARPRDRPPRRPRPDGRGAPHRADRRRGRVRHEQQRGGARARGRPRRSRRGRRLARRAGRDRRRRADPGDHPAGRREARSRSARRTAPAPPTSRRRSPRAARRRSSGSIRPTSR